MTRLAPDGVLTPAAVRAGLAVGLGGVAEMRDMLVRFAMEAEAGNEVAQQRLWCEAAKQEGALRDAKTCTT